MSSVLESFASLLPRPPADHPFDTVILCVFLLCSLVDFRLNRSGWACYVSSWFCILIFTFSLEACAVLSLYGFFLTFDGLIHQSAPRLSLAASASYFLLQVL
jgi:hypothetical protein